MILVTADKRSTIKGDRRGQTCCSLGAGVEGSSWSGGILREGLRLEDTAFSRNELPLRGNRRRRRHQWRHHPATAARALARQHDPLYFDVEDLADYRQRIVAAGGKILIEEQDVAGMGAFSLFTDPEGRMMGLWKQAKKP